jgi:U5 small nuclear ribonucleoprotein component
VDMVSKFIPSPFEATKKYIQQNYTGDRSTEIYEKMISNSKDCPLVLNVLKLYNTKDCKKFDALARVISGTVRKGQALRILGERYSLEDEEDMSVKTISNLWVYSSRYRIEVSEASSGNWVLIEGIDQNILKTATAVEAECLEPLEIFRPIKFESPAYFKLAIEPLIPSDLPKMLEGLRKVSKSYPLLGIKIEESGEHMILGSGELYIDSVMHDLRLMYSETEIKVSDPCVSFCETVIDTSSIKCSSETPNRMNKITMIAEPLDKGLDKHIELEHIHLSSPSSHSFLQKEFSWDILSAQSVWSFGPDLYGPNCLLDDTLPNETDRRALGDLRESIVQGFQWSCREGPLCEEPMRSVKFKIIEATIAPEPILRIPGQVIPTARRTCYSSFLMANPKILEPQLLTEIQCTGDSLPAVYNVLSRRRGHLIKEQAKPGSPLFTVRASIPGLDSFGFETDLRTHTTGQAFNLSLFEGWSVLPGDPLDRSIKLKVLEPSPPSHLAREILIKLR